MQSTSLLMFFRVKGFLQQQELSATERRQVDICREEKVLKTVHIRGHTFVIQKIPADGNCLLSALAHQIWGESITQQEK